MLGAASGALRFKHCCLSCSFLSEPPLLGLKRPRVHLRDDFSFSLQGVLVLLAPEVSVLLGVFFQLPIDHELVSDLLSLVEFL